MLNRDLLIIRYKQPFIDWVNEADPHPGEDLITLEDDFEWAWPEDKDTYRCSHSW